MPKNPNSPDPPRFTSGTPYDTDWFSIDLSSWMFTGDTIIETPTITTTRSDGIASNLTIAGVVATGMVVQWQVSGGTGGIDYSILVAVTTSMGRSDTIELKYFVRAV